MERESYIKFNCRHHVKEISFPAEIDTWLGFGNALKAHKLIGKIDDQTGYGNISFRDRNSGDIYISASKSGTDDTYVKSHFSRIVTWDAEINFVESEGAMPASSETLTHLAVYEALKEVNCVAHIHSEYYWNMYLNHELTSNLDIEYGTKEMYFEVKRLIEENANAGTLIMGGHKDGILFWDENIFRLKKTISRKMFKI